MRERLEEWPMNVALVGAGNIAGRYAEAILRTDGLELAGATDVDPAQPSWSAILAASPTPRWPTCSWTRRSTRSST